MIQEIINYINVQVQLENLLENSPYKKGSIIEMSDISAPTFYRKLKDKTFTPDELMKLAKILVPEEYYRYEVEMELLNAENDIKEGKFKKSADVISNLRKKLI